MDSKLPKRQTVITEANLRKRNLMGEVDFNEESGKFEITLDNKLTPEEKVLTLNHEFCHVRRNHKGYVSPKEENEVELEAIARTPKSNLSQAEGILHSYLVYNKIDPKTPLNPNNANDLKIILKRIKKIVVK